MNTKNSSPGGLDDQLIRVDEDHVEILEPGASRQRAALEQLEREVSELRRAAELKDGFLRTVAHDLQNPLSVIKGMGETLLNKSDRLPPALVPELIQAIVRQTNRVLGTLEDLLSLDRLALTTPEPVREWVDVAELIGEVIEGLGEPTAIEYDLDPIEANIDPTLLGRVIENLLRNAIQHQMDRAVVRVRSYPLEEPEGWFAISVIDQGPGVAPENRETIFHPYFRGDRRGVGLSIVRLFTELHGGDVQVADAPAGGTSFTVRMPRTKQEPPLRITQDQRSAAVDRRVRLEGLDRRVSTRGDRRRSVAR